MDNENDKEIKEIYSNRYMTVYSNGTMAFSDGVGYIDTLEESETKLLYEALHKFYKLKFYKGGNNGKE